VDPAKIRQKETKLCREEPHQDKVSSDHGLNRGTEFMKALPCLGGWAGRMGFATHGLDLHVRFQLHIECPSFETG
jgi:hypothetical protein